MEEEFGAFPSSPKTINKQQGQMLSIAQKAGASLVVLVQVKENSSEQRNHSLNSDDPSVQKIEVEIQGINVENRYHRLWWHSPGLSLSF